MKGTDRERRCQVRWRIRQEKLKGVRAQCAAFGFPVFCMEITQQIHSLRASGVISFHFARAAGSEMRIFRKSAGTLCTAPGEIAFLVMDFILNHCAMVSEHERKLKPARNLPSSKQPTDRPFSRSARFCTGSSPKNMRRM